MKPIFFVLAFIGYSSTLHSQIEVERIMFDSLVTSSSNSYSTYHVGSNYDFIENRFHEPNSAYYANVKSGSDFFYKNLGNLTNIQDSNGVISINFWWAFNHPELKVTRPNWPHNWDHGFKLGLGNDSIQSYTFWPFFEQPWVEGWMVWLNEDSLASYWDDIYYGGNPGYYYLQNIFFRDTTLNPLSADRYWSNVHIEIKSGTDSSLFFVDGILLDSFTMPIDTISVHNLDEWLYVWSYDNIIDDLIIFDGKLTSFQIDSIANNFISDSITNINASKGSYWNYNDTLSFEVNLFNDSVFHDSLILIGERGYHWQVNLGNGWNTHSSFSSKISFFNSPNSLYTPQQLDGGQIRCIVSGYGLDTSQILSINRLCVDTIIEHSPLTIIVPLTNEPVILKTSDEVGNSTVKYWQYTQPGTQYWGYYGGYGMDTLLISNPAALNGFSFRKLILGGCENDTSESFTLYYNSSCHSNAYSLTYYYPEDTLLEGFWNFNQDTILIDETGNHCGALTDTLSHFVSDRDFSLSSSLKVIGGAVFSNPLDSSKLDSAFTINFWFRSDSIQSSSFDFLNIYSHSGKFNSIELRKTSSDLRVYQSSITASFAYAGSQIPGTWSMMTIKYLNDTISLYLDAALMSKTSFTLNISNDMYLSIPSNSSTHRIMDEMTLWYRALDIRDLRNIYEGCIVNEIYKQPVGALAYTNPGISSFVTESFLDTSTTFQWQMNSLGLSWVDLSDNFQFTGTNTDSLYISNITIGMNNYKFRCLVNGCLSDTSEQVSLTVIDGIGLNEVAGKENYLYPNPTDGLLYIDLESKVDYYVYNMIGNIIAEGITENVIDISRLPSGTYVVVIGIKNEYFNHIVQKL